MKHYRVGGSTYGRLLQCRGSINQRDALEGTKQESIFMAQGTAMHKVLEFCVVHNDMPRDYLGHVVHGVEITQEMVDKVTRALDDWAYLQSVYDTVHEASEVEGLFAADAGGTCDLMAWSDETLVLADFKSGDGHVVDVTDNPQLMFYAASLMRNSDYVHLFDDVERIVLAILQPIERLDESYSVQVIAKADLVKFEKQAEIVIQESYDPDAPLNMGPECGFCPAQVFCPAKTGAAHDALLLDPDHLEDLTEALDLVGYLKDWIKAVESTALTQMEYGAQVEGYKLVNKRATRRWKDPEAALQYFRRRLGGKANLMSPEKLKTPLQVQKLAKALGKDYDFAPFIETSSSGYNIATVDDPREEAVSLAALKLIQH